MNPASIIAKARYEVCKDCPELRPVIKTCKQCGCFMPAKTRMMGQRCPIGEWEAMDKQDIEAALLAASEE